MLTFSVGVPLSSKFDDGEATSHMLRKGSTKHVDTVDSISVSECRPGEISGKCEPSCHSLTD